MKTTTKLTLASIATFANLPSAALTCAVLIAATALSPAFVIVSENFTYINPALNGRNGGTGFSGAWTSTSTVTGGVATGNTDSFRNLAFAVPSSGTLWLSFDWGFSTTPTPGASYGGLTFYVGGTEKFLIGNTFPASGSDVWRMNDGAIGSFVSANTTVQNSPGMKTGVARVTLGAGATSTVELWVGPTGSPVDVSGAPMATSTNRDLVGINRIRINGQDFGNALNSQSFDNLLIGTTMADVSAVPEPSAAVPVLGCLAGFALLRRRRA